MITTSNFANVLQAMDFIKVGEKYEKYYPQFDVRMKADIKNRKLFFPEEIKGRERNDYFDESHKENMVVFECVNRLLEKGYRPEHIELEKEWHLGHDAKSGRADICVTNAMGKMLFIIECKTAGREYESELRKTQIDGGQLLSYWQQERGCEWLLLYASDFVDGTIIYVTDSIGCKDDNNVRAAKKNDVSLKLYEDAHTTEELFNVWDETYDKRTFGDVVFREDTVAYKIGAKPLRKKDLRDFSENDKIVNRFEEILRHNNVSDKENAFNRLVVLFICKLVDEIQKKDEEIVEFQYKVGTDTYENLQDRLQRLHHDGMKKFMKEDIFYVSDSYAEDLIQQYTGQKREKLIADLKVTLRKLKFYTNNDFAFKDVHNEELFYQNGKILVEVVQLFEKYRIIGSNDLQTLGDLFEQLLNKGFKQNEGQFFTPIPITRFIWDSLPLKMLAERNDSEYPKIIDYACGAGHFLTQGYEAVNEFFGSNNSNWVDDKLYGVEKDYRLARVSKISLFMHGAGNGNIIFGDGLENYRDKNITPGSFDILVANPPYSVAAFKPHLSIKDNAFDVLAKISNNGSEIETLFVERMAQLLKPQGVAAVILPSSILSKESESFIAARESLLQNFSIKAVVQLGSKTFGATGTNTVVLFLEKFNSPPNRFDLCSDSVQAILTANNLTDWVDKDILTAYLSKIQVSEENYIEFVSKKRNYDAWADVAYIEAYVQAFIASTEYTNKTKQKSYQEWPEDKKRMWCNDSFYSYAINKEQEKLLYFSLAYGQMAIVINAPDDNKGQEKFLGYGWSNRKGQEGIQIKNMGGLMYSPTARKATDTLAALVRSAFDDAEPLSGDLSEYYHYMAVTDMLDFSRVDFNKAIKTTKLRHLVVKDGMTLYTLDSKDFTVSIGDRVVSDEIVEDGAYPVYSANVFEEFGRINKQNITDFSQPSVIWGIDGDWMVNYLPKNYPFYPTDHCGVIRVNTDKIVPKYLAHALQVEGEYERFSRSNRASTARIKSLTVQVPDMAVQKKVVDEIDNIDGQIAELEQNIRKCDEDIKARFVEMFGTFPNNEKGWPIGKIRDLVADVRYGSSRKAADGENGKYPYLRMNNITYNGELDLKDIKTIDIPENELPKCSVQRGDVLFNRTNSKELVGKTCVYNREELMVLAGFIIRIRLNEKALPEFVSAFLNTDFSKQMLLGMCKAAIGQANINATEMQNIGVYIPPVEEQNRFVKFKYQVDKSKNEAKEKISELKQQREAAINKYFK